MPAFGHVGGGNVMLRTELCERLGIEYPILSAGFGPGAGPDVVAGGSKAGGRGVLGAGGFGVPFLCELIGRVRGRRARPFAVTSIVEAFADGPCTAGLS